MDFFDISSIKADAANDAFLAHEEMVGEYLSLLEKRYCLQIGLSGKDSTTALNGAIDAMSRAISLGYIEKDHPIVAINVDTLLEPEAIQSYISFAHNTIQRHCDDLGIRMYLRIVSPPIYKHLMVLFAGAQKLPATSMSGRKAECSVIWKVETAINALKKIKSELPKKFQESTWISISGSRSDESVRRSKNMEKQAVKGVKSQALIEKIEHLGDSAAGKVFKFAPISDWSTPSVISYLNHCGSHPMSKTPINKKIAAYGKNFGLLLSIYGDGSNDRCEIVAQDDENKAVQKQCGAVARYGCVTCGLVSEDHSSIELKEYPRWARFGDETMRLRDFMVRVSSDVNHRALHARANDPVCNGNVFLQPNILKAKTLEKLIRYASQITVKSRAIHAEAMKQNALNNMHNDIGVKDILSDNSIPNSIKEEYKEMYVARLLEKPMFELFTEQHAVLLSLLWSLHGIATLPFRPVAILDSVKKGNTIPFPLTNSELNAKLARQGRKPWDHPSNLNRTIPDALVAQLFKPAKLSFSELKSLHGDSLNEEHLQEYMPVIETFDNTARQTLFDATGSTYCHSESKAKETRSFKLSYDINIDTQLETVAAIDKITSKRINLENNKPLKEALLELGRNDYLIELEQSANSLDLSIEDTKALREKRGGVYGVTANHEFNNQHIFTSDIKYIESEKLRKKRKPGKKMSLRKRTFSEKTGKHTTGRASLKVYSTTTIPALEEQSTHAIRYWLPDFAVIRQSAIDTHNEDELSIDESKHSFVFDNEIFSLWLEQGGWERLVLDHDRQLQSLIKKRLPVRMFSGTEPVYYLTNNTGLTITDNFKKYMLKTLRRTELYDSAKLFNLAPLPISKLSQFSSVVSMSVHRTQKANHLLAIRYLKNKRRKAIKKVQSEFKLSSTTGANLIITNVSTRINEFMSQYFNIAKMFVTASAFSPFSDEAKSRTIKSEIWLNEFNYVLKNIDNALDLLATSQEVKLINDDYESKKVVTTLFSDLIKSKSKDLKKFAAEPLLLLENIQKENLGDSFIAYSAQYKATGKASELISLLAAWITSNYARTNKFLVENGLTTCFAFMSGKDYLSPVVKDVSASNTREKIKQRALTSQSHINGMTKALRLEQSALRPIVGITPLGDDIKRQAIDKVSIQAKANKLSSLMVSNIKKSMAMRKNTALNKV